ncbi:RidA family protein [Chryseobacterium sp. Mn2064]|uniref:RidA family protein n=1 Tax=Chryseobacterium sp. Mn2064 TaxID=3395263 RepID=UPI003BC5A7C9
MRNKKITIYKWTTAITLCLSLAACAPNPAIIKISSPDVSKAIGPYSHAIKAGNLIFCSGQLGLLPATGELSGNEIESQTRQSILNIKSILESAGSDLSKVTKVTIFLADMSDYTTVNRIYSEYFSNHPARSTVQVAKLPKNGLIEIECIAIVH